MKSNDSPVAVGTDIYAIVDSTGKIYDTFLSLDIAENVLVDVYRSEDPETCYTLHQLCLLTDEAVEVLLGHEKDKLNTLSACIPPESRKKLSKVYLSKYKYNAAELNSLKRNSI